MTDLRDKVPKSDPDKDAAADYGLTALSALVPVFGTAIADLTRGILDRKAEERRHEFNAAVADELDALAKRVEELTPAAILQSDDFLAAYATAIRVASETASQSKRRRLARALASMGPSQMLPPYRKDFYFGLATRYSDVHIAVLKFLRNPRPWLDAPRRASWGAELPGWLWVGVRLFPDADGDELRDSLTPVSNDLVSDGLADFEPHPGREYPILTAPGQGFLNFVAEPE